MITARTEATTMNDDDCGEGVDPTVLPDGDLGDLPDVGVDDAPEEDA